MGEITKRLDQVRRRIAAAAGAAGRSPESVRLVAVSKTKPADAIREAYDAGQRDFGENYVQEMQRKAEELADLGELRWHLIGHLQRNKAKVVAMLASAVHTVDSIRLVEELDRRAATVPETKRFFLPPEADGRLVVLLEVNVGGEASKSGCAPDELGRVLDALGASRNLRLGGLMTMPPWTEDPADSRPHFDRLLALRERHGGRDALPELSMGMSRDLEHAVAAGATIVRVGSAIFGPRS